MKYKFGFKKFLLACFLTLFVFLGNAQLATYPLKSGTLTPANPGVGNPYPSSTGLTSANVTATIINVGSEITNQPNGTFNSTGLRVRPNTLAWPLSVNNGFCVNATISPKANYDFVLSSVTFKNNALDNTPNLWCQLAYQANSSGNWINIGTPQAVTAANVGTTITIGGLNEGFYNGNTYVFRLFFYGNGANDKNQGFRMADLVFNGTTVTPPAINPTVHTTGVNGTGFYSTNATGTYDIGAGFRIVNRAGFLCGTNNTPTFANATPTYVSTLGSPMNETINGLTPGVSYYVRAFAITQTDTILANIGDIVFLKTNDPQEPLINTLPPAMATVVRATTGGWGIDSAGQPVLEKGVLYSTNPVMMYPTTPHTSDGNGNDNFYTKINNLQPSTKYYVMAYARNSIGVGYGNLDSIVTPSAMPYIAAVPGDLDFGDVVYNSAATVLSYKLTAGNLNPSGGVITLNATNGYTICATYNGTYTTSLPITYAGSTITNKVIYVKTKTTTYGILNGIVTHSGGGVVAPNADTVFIKTNIIQNQDTLSNMGTDFWAGFGCQEKMSQNTSWSDTSTGSAAGAHLTLYIAAGAQAANVIVEMPGIAGANTFPRTLNIAANSVGIVNGFPIPTNDPKNTTNSADSRLYYTGVSSRGIHVYSTNGAPVACWLYDWATNNSAAGSMLFPTNTWNSSYAVQTYGNDKSNTGDPSSYFFVIASQDSTAITFTPTADIVDSASSPIITGNPGGTILYAKGGTYTVLLKKKGDVFNALGLINSSTNISQDLTGTKVSTTCDKKIAVFGGNSRTLISTTNCGSVSSGSDNLIQQMFPSVAWGTKYLTVPTKTMEYNLFRITVSDPVTKVFVDNVLYTTASPKWNATGKFYAIEGNQPHLITSDLPVSVTQFILPGTYCGGASVGNNGPGDPEMLLLSPIQQAIKSATVYCPDFKNGNSGAGYLNVIIHKSGVDSFKLDNKIYSSTVDTGNSSYSATPYGSSGAVLLKNAFVKHPLDTNYRYAKFKVSYPATHTLSSTVAFNAIAYGTANGESWGYNAGTAINNLTAINVSQNPAGSDTSSTSVKAVVDNQVYLQIAVPYDSVLINSITWSAQGNPNVNPNTTQTSTINPSTNKPYCLDTIVKDGRTFFVYQCQVPFTFSEIGAYKIKVTFNGTFVSDCGGTDDKYTNVIVGKDDISFDYTRTPAGDCTSKTIVLIDNSTGFAGTSIKTYVWDYGDGSKKDTITSTTSGFPYPTPNSHTYPNNDLYYLKLTTVNSIGGISTDSFTVDLRLLTPPQFSKSADTICIGSSITFTNTFTTGGVKWFWDYGDGSAIDSTLSNTPVSHIYTTEGKKIVKHWIKNNVGCPSSTAIDSIQVAHKPIASFTPPSGVCLPGTTLFINTSDTSAANGTPYTYHWNFGVLALTNDTSNVKDGTYTYTTAPGAGEYIVKLVAKSKYGCKSDTISQTITNVYPKPSAVIGNTSSKKVCAGGTANFFDASTATNQTINGWYWNFGDGGTSASQNPSYTGYVNNQLYTVKLAVKTDKGCISDTALWTIKVNPKPTVGTILPSTCITSGSMLFKDNCTVPADDSVQTPYSYNWDLSGGPGGGPQTTKDATYTLTTPGTYYIYHSISTANGCFDDRKDTFTISGSKPVPKHNIISRSPLTKQICNNDSIYLRDSSTVAIGTIKKVEIYWDIYNSFGIGLNTNPTVDNSPQNGVLPTTTKAYSFKYPYSHLSKTVFVRTINYTDNNCYSEDTVQVTIFGMPKIKFEPISGICVNGSPKKINLAYDSSGRFDQVPALVFGGKPTYSGTGVYNDSMFNPTVAGVGTHQIKVVYELTSAINNHCIDSAFAPITVWALPQPAIQVSNPTCEKNKISFSDKTPAVSGSGNISSWSWNFGDPGSGVNNISSLQNPSHTYGNYGSYNVTLTATSDSGCVGTMTTPVVVNVHPLPQVGFIPPNGTCAGTPVTFKDTSKIADGSESQFTHVWTFGDPGSGALNTATGTPLINASHLYNGTPTDSIKLVVTSKDGCIDSLAIKLSNTTIHPKPTANFVVNGNFRDTARACSGNALIFKDSSSEKSGTSYWIWGDNGTSVEINNPANHTFNSTATQTYIGSHYIDDIYGCRSDTIKVISTVWALPTISIGVSTPTCEKNAVNFTDNSTAGAGSGNVSKWKWKFGEPGSGPNDSSSIKNPKHTYAAYGLYDVYLTATTDSGCVATNTTATVVNVHPLPKVIFTNPNGICAGSALNFTDNSTIVDGSEAQFNYVWNFGDGGAASGVGNASASHSYSSTPTDSIRLKITSKDGCIDSLVKKLSATIFPKQSVKMNANSVSYNASTDTVKVCLGNPITFANTNTPTVTKSYWDLGDPVGTIVNGNTQTHTYPNAQMYYGQHYADDNNNCKTDTINFKVLIWSLPTVLFDTPTIKCEKGSVTFTDKSIANYGTITAWSWNFGDPGSGVNNTSAVNPTQHNYNNYGTFNVTLKVTTSNGCSATLTPAKQVIINPKPKANFIMQDTTCLPLPTKFTSTTTIADGSSPVAYLWNFGDPASGVLNVGVTNPTSHVYPSSANYNVQLIVSSKDGCTDTTNPAKVLKASSLHNTPVALYSVNTVSHDTPRVCVGVPIIFKDASSNVQTSYWVWGDNGSITEIGSYPAPQFTTTPAGIYYGQHYIDDNFGCRSLPTPIVTIIDALPTITGKTEYVMPNIPITLTPVITNATNFMWTVKSPSGLFDDYLDYNDVETPTCTPLTDITYLITVSNDGGCKDTASYNVKLLKTPIIPTAFSPNGDGINDTWIIDNLKEYPGAIVQVFNRWGQLVLNKFGYSSPWNGKMNNTGTDLPIGVYYYIIKPSNILPVMTGYVTILR